jgi:mRNA deadenylase 3'-5' endonuclease subunit Ccr4
VKYIYIDFNFTPNTPIYAICVQKTFTDSFLDHLQRPPSTDILDALSDGADEHSKEVKKQVLQGFIDVDTTSWNHQIKQIIQNIEKEPHMKSVYSSYSRLDSTTDTGEPKYTNFCHSFKATLDYIFLIGHISKPSRLMASQLLSIPDEEYITQSVALPNHIFGSDHIALMCKFIFVDPS